MTKLSRKKLEEIQKIGDSILKDISEDMDKRIEKIEFGDNSWLDISKDKTKLCPVCQNYTPEMRIVCDNPFCPYF